MLSNLTWFVLYTRPRFEQKVNDELVQMGFESFLPKQRTLKQWSDRKKWVDEPLFKSYCFVRIIPEYYREPLKVTGVVRYVWLEGKPSPVRDSEIESIRMLCSSELPIEVVATCLEKGQRITINGGPLNGLSGEYIKSSGQHKVLVRIDSISHGLLVSVPPAYVVTC